MREETEQIIANDSTANLTDSTDAHESDNITSKAELDIILMITTPSC